LGNVHHLGRIGHWAEMAVAEGLVALHFANVLSYARVAPFGGADGRFGTNPFCVGIPLPDEAPFMLDMATSAAAQGKLRVAHNKGDKVPFGLLGGALTGGGTWHYPNTPRSKVMNSILVSLTDAERLGTASEFRRE